jgi:hypothetical protein
MRDHPAGVAANPVGLIAIAFFLATPMLAQSPRPSESDPARARFEDTSRREMQLRSMGNTTKKTTDPKELEAIVAQVKQDFERILTLHNEIVRAISADKVLDQDFVSSATAEIKKRASRLQTTLALDQPAAGEQNQQKVKKLDGAHEKDALIMLCKQIKSFVQNPVIETPGTVDIQQLARARRDLQDVIQLGDSINKSAERLKKTVK